MEALARNGIAAMLILAFLAIPIVACTDGVTPDCSGPEAGCAPDLSGSLDTGSTEPYDADQTYGEAAAPTDSSVPPTDSGASLDAADAHG
jgi:hypothetical protein